MLSSSKIKGSVSKKTDKKIRYILCAEDIIRKEGLQALNIRRIAEALNCNSATLYNYFSDLEELIVYASFSFRKTYLEELSKSITEDMPAIEQYIKMYEIYCDHSFENPEVAYNLYFGKYSDNMVRIRKEYYQLFPEEFPKQTELITKLLTAPSVFAADEYMLLGAVREGKLKEEDVKSIASIVVRTQANYMHELIIKPYLDSNDLKERFLKELHFIIDKCIV